MSDWKIFQGCPGQQHDGIERLPGPPPWREFSTRDEQLALTFRPSAEEIGLVNAALYLRRPLLVTGPPGTGKSSLAYAVAWELKLDKVLRWSVTSRSSLQEGLYSYDALARLRDVRERKQEHEDGEPAGTEDIGRYIRLNALGMALLPGSRPRVLLIDEIDKSDADLPNDLLHAFEEGRYEVPELMRIAEEHPDVAVQAEDREGNQTRVIVSRGKVRCQAFPFVILTSNNERELPPPFLRRCLRLDLQIPDRARLENILLAHLDYLKDSPVIGPLVTDFLARRGEGKMLATDQLLNAVFLMTRGTAPSEEERKALLDVLFRELGRT